MFFIFSRSTDVFSFIPTIKHFLKNFQRSADQKSPFYQGSRNEQSWIFKDFSYLKTKSPGSFKDISRVNRPIIVVFYGHF